MFQKEQYGLRLKNLRKGVKETQADLAALLGVKPNQVVEMENGRKTTTFDVSADYLLGLFDEPRILIPPKKEGT